MDMNQEQVNHILSYIDQSQPETVKCAIFSRLGHECFRTRKMDAWVAGFQGDVQAFLDLVNLEGKSPYWERLEFNADRSVLYLTGRVVAGCACDFARSENPPAALCRYCCKAFQEDIFGALFNRKVEVEITEAFLLGGQRCSTAIHFR